MSPSMEAGVGRRGRRRRKFPGADFVASSSSPPFCVTVAHHRLVMVASAALCCFLVSPPSPVLCFSPPLAPFPPALLPTFANGKIRSQVPRSRGAGEGAGGTSDARHSSRPFSLLPTLGGKAWDRLDIPEETTKKWYTLKCIAGTELECLSQCRLIFRDDPNVDRFLVPTQKIAKTRGAKRIVQDVPVYPGYVFARLRLCEDVYETVHGLASVSSWVGTMRKVGYQKLPTIPTTLPPDEIKKMEKLEETMMLADIKTDDQLVNELLYDFKNLEVGGMVKVIKGIHTDEDGIVQRFKDGKVCVRMYTYGSQFDEWLDPNDVRPLTAGEVTEGITAGRPINQEQFNKDAGLPPPGRRGGDRDGDTGGDQGRSFSRRNLVNSSLGGNQRNRRQDQRRRSEDVEAFRVSDGQLAKEDQYWEEYQAKNKQQRDRRRQQRQQQQQKQGQGRRGGGSEYDVDSQWGRGGPGPGAGGRRGRGAPAIPSGGPTREEDALSGGEDWSAFVGDADAGGDDDAFFDDLLSELSGALDDDGGGGGGGGGSTYTEEREVVRDIQQNLGGAAETASRASSSLSSATVDDDDDFFARLEEEMGGGRRRGGGARETMARDAPPAPSSDEDFFATLEHELEEELAVVTNAGIPAAEAPPSEVKGTRDTSAGPRIEKVELSDLTVPQLKERLREKGLKVSGKKAELISRLGEEKQQRSSPSPSTSSTPPAPTESLDPRNGIDHGETEATKPRPGAAPASGLDDAFFGDDEDDFFESLEREMAAADGTMDDSNSAAAATTGGDDDLFLDELEGVMDFELEGNDDTMDSSSVTSAETTDAYAATTTKPGDDEADVAHVESVVEVGDAVSSRPQQHVANEADLAGLTVPMLKERLRERGLKVSGKKSELIERLSMS